MKFTVQAACHCHTGRIRKKNEDNFFFDGKCLEQEHSGLEHPLQIEENLRNGFGLAVFDGMGGENFGEMASFATAKEMCESQRNLEDCAIPEIERIENLVQKLNKAVLKSQQQMLTDKMGTTMASLFFWDKNVYACNVGDSRVYRLRNGELRQISLDHVEKRPVRPGRKPALIQYLGIDTEEFEIEPHITKEEIQKEDTYH